MKIQVTYEFDFDDNFVEEINYVQAAIEKGVVYPWLKDTSKAPGRVATNLIKACGPEPISFKFVSEDG